MTNELDPDVYKDAAAEAALLEYADDPDWAFSASMDMVCGEYGGGVDDLLAMFDRVQVTPVPHDVIENARKVLTDPEEWGPNEIARVNRVLDKVAALGEGPPGAGDVGSS